MDENADPTIAEVLGIPWEQPEPFDPRDVPPGTLDARILDQDQVWVDRFGQVHQLRDMCDAYRANVLAHLYIARSDKWCWAALNELLTSRASMFVLTRATGVPMIAELSATQWLESTPLARGLRRLTPGIAAPVVLEAWAAKIHRLSELAGRPVWQVPGSQVAMPQDPRRSWTHDMRDRPPGPEGPDENW